MVVKCADLEREKNEIMNVARMLLFVKGLGDAVARRSPFEIFVGSTKCHTLVLVC